MSPRRSAADARVTRDRLVNEATMLASNEGLEGLSVGRVAEAAGLSKSGVTRHFPTKEQLQLAALDNALTMFGEVVWKPASEHPPGLARVTALCRNWVEYLAGDDMPGGCFLTGASAEFDGRADGPVRDAIKGSLERWLRLLAREIRGAIDAGELPPGVHADTLAFELNSFALAANQSRQLLGDDDAPARSFELMRASLQRAARR